MANHLVDRVVELIDTNYADAVSLRTLSSSVDRQPAYLGRLFRHEVGKTVREYLTAVRLEHAAALIREGVKVEAVALSVGYRSKKNFYQQFKRRYGMTPLLYRCQCGDAHECHRPHLPVPSHIGAAHAGQPLEADGAGSTMSVGTRVAGRLRRLIQASNRAWRLAARMQHLLLQQFDQTGIGLLITDEAGRYVGANHAAVVATGYSPVDMRRLSSAQLFISAPTGDTRCVWQMLHLRRASQNAPPNAVIRTKCGEAVPLDVVTIRNVLWGCREMRAMLEALPSQIG